MGTNYMTRLSKWAHWMLSTQEAEDVIADYQDIVGILPRPEEELLRDLGGPRNVIKALVQPEQYRVWLAGFLVMSVCILTLGFSPIVIGYPIWLNIFSPWTANPPIPPIVAVLGAVTALMWFHRQGQKGTRLPKAIPILLVVLLAWCGGVLLLSWVCAYDFDSFLNVWRAMMTRIGLGKSIYQSLHLIVNVMVYGSMVISLAGEAALVKARIKDRRWAAVYVLALTAMLTSLLFAHGSTRMDITLPVGELYRQLLLKSAGIAAIGLIGAGVALY